jgi:ABC-type amino acid transport substrate-binding protein
VKRAIATIVAAVATAMSVWGGPAAAQAPAAKGAQTKGSAASPAAAATPDTLARIKAAKAITVAFSGDSLPFSFVGKDQQPAGYSIDLCKRVIAHVGRVTGVPDLKVNWVVGTVAERLAMVASGKADLDCANTTATQTRMRDVDFSSLIFLDGGGLVVKAGASLQKFADLDGKNIGVIGGTTTEARLDAMLKQRMIKAKVTTVQDGNAGMALLESGALDAFASDKIKLVGLAAQAKDPKALALLPEDLSIEPLAFALPRGDSAFRLEVNSALTQVYISPEIETIFNQWLGPIGRPSGLLSAMFILNVIPK